MIAVKTLSLTMSPAIFSSLLRLIKLKCYLLQVPCQLQFFSYFYLACMWTCSSHWDVFEIYFLYKNFIIFSSMIKLYNHYYFYDQLPWWYPSQANSSISLKTYKLQQISSSMYGTSSFNLSICISSVRSSSEGVTGRSAQTQELSKMNKAHRTVAMVLPNRVGSNRVLTPPWC